MEAANCPEAVSRVTRRVRDGRKKGRPRAGHPIRRRHAITAGRL